MIDEDDGIRFVRGLAIALPLSLALWTIIFFLIWVFAG